MRAFLSLATLLLLAVSQSQAAEITAEPKSEANPVTVQRIVLNSLVPGVDPTVLTPILAGYENRPLTFVQLVELQNQLNNTLAQHGQTSVQASIGDIGSNTLTIQLANRPGIETNNLAEAPAQPSQTAPQTPAQPPAEGIAALGVAEGNTTTTQTASPIQGREANSTSLGDRYWQRFFQARPTNQSQQ